MQRDELRLTGLSPNVKYFYSVGTSATTLAGGNDVFFVTAPSAPTVTAEHAPPRRYTIRSGRPPHDRLGLRGGEGWALRGSSGQAWRG